MSIEAAVTILTTMVGVGVTIMLAGIPWAYSIQGRLTRIETRLTDHIRFFDTVATRRPDHLT